MEVVSNVIRDSNTIRERNDDVVFKVPIEFRILAMRDLPLSNHGIGTCLNQVRVCVIVREARPVHHYEPNALFDVSDSNVCFHSYLMRIAVFENR